MARVHIKKNLLDLEYNTHLQYFNTAIIVLFTYLIGLSLAIITRQVRVEQPTHVIGIMTVSVIISGVSIAFMIYCRDRMRLALKNIQKL